VNKRFHLQPRPVSRFPLEYDLGDGEFPFHHFFNPISFSALNSADISSLGKKS
jgi:hypothetical protein